MSADEPKEPGFDARLRRLEALVAELEEGGLDLEPAIEKYQEGIGLLKECHTALAGYQKQVEELTRDAEMSLRPFEGDPDRGDGAPDLGPGAGTDEPGRGSRRG
jgi:exodeoxyribonuclease VII small subunit